MSARNTGRRLTPDEIDTIIELKLDRVPVRDICTRVGCAIETVQRHWTAWLDAASEERRSALERYQTEVMVRLGQIADDARRGAVAAEDDSVAVVRFLNVERQALVDVARVGGFFGAHELQVSGGFEFPSDEEARAILDQLPD